MEKRIKRNSGDGEPFLGFFIGLIVMFVACIIFNNGCTPTKQEMIKDFGEPQYGHVQHVVIKNTGQRGVIYDIELNKQSDEDGWTYRIYLYDDNGWILEKIMRNVRSALIRQDALEIIDPTDLELLES